MVAIPGNATQRHTITHTHKFHQRRSQGPQINSKGVHQTRFPTDRDQTGQAWQQGVLPPRVSYLLDASVQTFRATFQRSGHRPEDTPPPSPSAPGTASSPGPPGARARDPELFLDTRTVSSLARVTSERRDPAGKRRPLAATRHHDDASGQKSCACLSIAPAGAGRAIARLSFLQAGARGRRVQISAGEKSRRGLRCEV